MPTNNSRPGSLPSNGITTLVDPENPALDIIFVHGFTGDLDKTWRYSGPDIHQPKQVKEQPPPGASKFLWATRHILKRRADPYESEPRGTYWPQDLLPLTVPDARILTYGYDSHVRHILAGQISQSTVYDIAWDFLVALESQRRDNIWRPIVFIAHSLGGIVVKEMLRRSDGCQGQRLFLQSIAKSTHGIIFFGTPHGGADPRGPILRIAERAVKAAGFSVNQQIVSTLLPSSERLRELRDEFGPLATKYHWVVHSFQEQYGVTGLGGKKVVDDTSSYLNLPDLEITEHITQNHIEMCRFKDLNDNEYAKLVAALTRMVKSLPTIQRYQKHNRDAEQNISLSEIKQSLQSDHDFTRFESIAGEHHQTCAWIFKKSQYLDWIDTTKYDDHHGILWISGKPGAGKSTLTKYIVKQALHLYRDELIIFFFFNARGSDLEKSTIGMYRSLITQLLVHFQTQDLRSILPKKLPKWNVENLQQFLRLVIVNVPPQRKLFCYIDALDECNEDLVREMVSFFEELGKLTADNHTNNLFVCFSSRHYPRISVQHSCAFTLEDSNGHSQDLKTYVNDKLRIGNSKLAQKIKDQLLSKASGVFLWVALVVSILNKEFDYGRMHAMQQRLLDIPSDLHALFEDMITRNTHSKKDLELCVRWILYARHTLSPWQLYHGILSGTDIDAGTLADLAEHQVPDDIIDKFIIDSSMGLAEIVQTPNSGNKVQFIHESVRDFLLKEDGLRMICLDHEGSQQGMSHEILKEACATYISNCLANIPSSETDLVPKSSQFLEYAVHNILWHADKAQGSGQPQVDFLLTFNLEVWLRLSAVIGITTGRQGYRLLYILAEEDLANLISANSWDISPFEVGIEPAGTPWRAALRSGSFNTVTSLIEVEVRRHPTDGVFQGWDIQRLSLYRSISERMLKYQTESDHKYSNQTIMFDAARDGDVELLRFLLMSGRFNVNRRDSYGRTVLGSAMRCEKCVRLLLSLGSINVNIQDKLGQTALFMPAIGGRIKLVYLLLAAPGFLPDLKDNSGRTALSHAAGTWMEQVATVRALLNTGLVDPDAKDQDGRTPLSYAAERGHDNVIRLLLATRKVDVDCMDNRGATWRDWYNRGCAERNCISDPPSLSPLSQ